LFDWSSCFVIAGTSGMTQRQFHLLIAIILLICLLCPFIEIGFHSDDSIFLTGDDTESTLVVLLLLLEFACLVAKLIVVLLPSVVSRVHAISPHPILRSMPELFVLEASSPIPLRI
jgi:hypothetical protein